MVYRLKAYGSAFNVYTHLRLHKHLNIYLYVYINVQSNIYKLYVL